MVDSNKNDDAFEDADFEDLDPIEDDDLGDDGWDDDLGGGADTAESVGGDPESTAPKQKTFVQKNFMLIVGGVVVLFGGVIGASLLSGGSSEPLPDEQAAAPGDALPDAPATTAYEEGADSMPPMPAPINPGEADGALTPMPTPAELENTELAELDVEEIPARSPNGMTPQGEAPFDYRPNDQREASDEPAPKNAAEKLNDEFAKRSETAAADAPVPDSQKTIIDSEGNLLAMPASVMPDNQPEPVTPAEEAPAPDLALQPEAQKAEASSLLSKLNAETIRAEDAEKSAQALRQQLDLKTSEIGALSKKVAELEEKLAMAESAAARAPTPKDSAPKKVAVPKKESAGKEPVRTETPAKPAVKQQAAPPVAKPVAWELKAAQPGKAVLYSRATGDTRNIAVGDTVEGLGQIASISNETGRWVVRGSRGQVTR